MRDRPESAAPEVLIADAPCEETARLVPLLEQQGYCIQSLNSAAEAAAALAAALPDLLLLGVQLDDGCGYEFCQALKSEPRTRELPVVLLGWFPTAAEKLQAFHVGGLDYLTKPFELDEAVVRLRNHLNLQSALKLLAMQNQLLADEIQERQRAETALRLSEEKFAKTFRSNPNPITVTRLRDGCHLDVNETFCRLTGYRLEEIVGRTAQELQLWVSMDARQALFERLQADGSVHNYEFQFRTKDGQTRTALLSAEVIQLQGEDCLLSLSNDITERVRAEVALQQANQELQRLAALDGLTQVANRRCFDERLAEAWQRSQQTQQPLSLLLCDVDCFKLYNDTYGHQAGDTCLQQVAQTLTANVQHPEALVARYGGEEFAVILPNVDSAAASQLADTLRQAVANLQIGHAQSTVASCVTLSLGVATTRPDAQFSPEALIGVADIGLYEAKRQGRNRSVIEVF